MKSSRKLTNGIRSLSYNEKLKKQMLRGGAGSVTLKGLNTLIGVATTILLARLLGADGYGIYAYAFAIVTLLSLPTQLGLPPLIVRETARGQVNKSWGQVAALWRWAGSFVLVVSSMTLFACLFLLWLAPSMIQAESLQTFVWALFLIPLIALGNLRGAALRGLRKVVIGQLPEKFIRPFLLLILLVITSFLASLTPARAMLAHVVAAVIAFLIGAILLRIYAPAEIRLASPASSKSNQWLLSIVPLALASGVQIITTQTDIIILGLYRESQEVGVYRATVQVASIMVIALNAINTVIAPYLALYYERKDSRLLRRIIRVCSTVVTAASFPILIFFIFFSEALLDTLFGPEYASGGIALVLLACGQFVILIVGPATLFLKMASREWLVVRASAAALAINVALNLLFVPEYGVEGAASATLISIIIWRFLLWRSMNAILKEIDG